MGVEIFFEARNRGRMGGTPPAQRAVETIANRRDRRRVDVEHLGNAVGHVSLRQSGDDLADTPRLRAYVCSL